MFKRSPLIERLAADAERMQRILPAYEISPAMLAHLQSAIEQYQRFYVQNPRLFEVAAGLRAQLQNSPILDLAAGLNQQLTWLYPDEDEPYEDDEPQPPSVEEIHAPRKRRGRRGPRPTPEADRRRIAEGWEPDRETAFQYAARNHISRSTLFKWRGELGLTEPELSD